MILVTFALHDYVFIRSGDFIFSDSRDSMSMFEVESLIQFLCTS